MTVALDQAGSFASSNNVSTTTLTSTFSVNPQAGSTVFVVGFANATTAPNTPTDNGSGNTWALEKLQNTTKECFIYRASNINVPGGAFAVTITKAAVDFWSMIAVSFLGLRAPPPVDQVGGSASGSGTAIATPNVGTLPGDLYIGAMCGSGGGGAQTYVGNPGTILGSQTNGNSDIAGSIAYLIGGAAPANLGWTLGTSQNNVEAVIGSFLSATGGMATSPQVQRTSPPYWYRWIRSALGKYGR